MSSFGGAGPGDPGDHLDDHRRNIAHRVAIDALLDQYSTWMLARCRVAAHRHGLDYDDVYQLTLVRLLQSSRSADLTDAGLLAWLGQRIDWAAGELVRKRGHDGGERLGDDAIAILLDAAVSALDDPGQGAIDPILLRRMGLTDQQIDVLLVVCSGLDLPLRDVAHLVGRSYAAVRKDKQRAVDQIERWLALDPEERLVYVAFRETRSVHEAARRTGHNVMEFRILLDAATRKVNACTENGVDSDA